MGGRPAFPPSVVVAIQALACELPFRRGLPLARWSVAELRQEAMESGIVAKISHCVAGSVRTRCVGGATAAGFFRVIRSLLAKPDAFSTCINAAGKV